MDGGYRIMIVEDDSIIAEMLKKGLCAWGFDAFCQGDFERVLDGFQLNKPQLVILDISLPFYNGYYWCEKIREVSQVPILFLSSRSHNMDIIMAISMGGDDYVTKPFDMDVLRSKVQALLRRAYSYAGNMAASYYAGASMDFAAGTISRDGKTATLTKNEQRILSVLYEKRGRIVSRDALMMKLWDTDTFVDDNTLTVNIARLRRKLTEIGLGELIKTRKGAGYIMEEPQ